jgi:hypothetical protein
MGRNRRLSSGFGVPVLGASGPGLGRDSADAEWTAAESALQHSAALGQNDDAAEKEAAQRQYEMQQQQLGLRAPPPPSPSAEGTPRRRAASRRRRSLVPDAERRRLVYENCIKLSAANKISQKNTWQLGLIDYMEDVWNPHFPAHV